jgi:hypothetical protein
VSRRGGCARLARTFRRDSGRGSCRRCARDCVQVKLAGDLDSLVAAGFAHLRARKCQARLLPSMAGSASAARDVWIPALRRWANFSHAYGVCTCNTAVRPPFALFRVKRRPLQNHGGAKFDKKTNKEIPQVYPHRLRVSGCPRWRRVRIPWPLHGRRNDNAGKQAPLREYLQCFVCLYR